MNVFAHQFARSEFPLREKLRLNRHTREESRAVDIITPTLLNKN